MQALPRWAANLAVPPDEHIEHACAACGDCSPWLALQPAAASSASEGSAEYRASSDWGACSWKCVLDEWDR